MVVKEGDIITTEERLLKLIKDKIEDVNALLSLYLAYLAHLPNIDLDTNELYDIHNVLGDRPDNAFPHSSIDNNYINNKTDTDGINNLSIMSVLRTIMCEIGAGKKGDSLLSHLELPYIKTFQQQFILTAGTALLIAPPYIEKRILSVKVTATGGGRVYLGTDPGVNATNGYIMLNGQAEQFRCSDAIYAYLTSGTGVAYVLDHGKVL